MSYRSDPDWIKNQWKWRWILLDGALNIIYFLVFCSIAYLWMPTKNNERYGLDQLADHDHDFDESYVVFDNEDDENNHMKNRGPVESEAEILAWAEQNIEMDNLSLERSPMDPKIV
jgi:hypothetical protein